MFLKTYHWKPPDITERVSCMIDDHLTLIEEPEELIEKYGSRKIKTIWVKAAESKIEHLNQKLEEQEEIV